MLAMIDKKWRGSTSIGKAKPKLVLSLSTPFPS